jgi:replicative DNA helicase
MSGATSHDVEAEKAVIGALLRSARRVLELVLVEPRSFFAPAHQAIATAALDLVAQGKPVDELTVGDQLGSQLAPVGGYAYLAELASGHLTAENVAHYVAIVRDHALKRRVCLAASEVLQVASNAHDSGEDAHAELLRQASSVEGPEQADRAVTLLDVMDESLKRVVAAAMGEASKVRTVLTGYSDVDDLTGGLALGAVTILAGRPSQGKSALARRIAMNAAIAGVGVQVFSLEDTRDRYADRCLSDVADVDLAKFSDRKPIFSAIELVRLKEAKESAKCLPLVIDDSAGLGAMQIANRVRMRKRALNTSLVVVDYVQLMRERGSRDKRAEVDAAMEGMVRLAREEGVAVLLLSQLSRDSEKRDDKRPMLSDLRESGTLEQAADAVFMVHQEWRYLNAESKNAEVRAAYEKAFNFGELLVRKNKHGQQGEVRLRWNPMTATYHTVRLRDRY